MSVKRTKAAIVCVISSIFYCVFCIKLHNVHVALGMLTLVVFSAIRVANTKAVHVLFFFFRSFFQLMQCVKLAELAPNVSLA